MKLLIGDSGKKAAAVLAVAFFTLCLLTVVGCGNGTGKDNGKAIKSNPQPATLGNTWTGTAGAVSSYEVYSLAYDSGRNLLYAGTYGQGAWKYDGTTWTETGGSVEGGVGGGVSSYQVRSLAYDSGHNLLYASFSEPFIHTGRGVWRYNGH